MTNATLAFAIDLNGDGDFTDSDEDISDFVMEGSKWGLGLFGQPAEMQGMAEPAYAELIVRNETKKFSPAHGSSIASLGIGKVLKITSNDGTTTFPEFRGWIEAIEPVPGTYGERTALIIAGGWLTRMQATPVSVPMQEDRRAEQVIEEIVRKVNAWPPGFAGAILVGNAVRAIIGTGIIGADSYWQGAYWQAGDETIDWVGDFDDDATVYGAIVECVAREGFGALFWVDESGTLNFVNRLNFLTDITSDRTFANTEYTDIEYEYGTHIFNQVRTSAKPRNVGTSAEVLAVTDNSIAIAAGETVRVIFRLRQSSDGAKLALKPGTMVTPSANTDYAARVERDGTGTNLTDSISATVIEQHARLVTIDYSMAGSTDGYLNAGLQVRGYAIREYSEIEFDVEDTASITSYGRRPFDYPGMSSNAKTASDLGVYILESMKNEGDRLITIGFWPERTTTAFLTKVLTTTLMDRLTINTDGQVMGANTDVFVVGKETQLIGNKIFRTLSLRPIDRARYMIIGSSIAGKIGTGVAGLF